MASKKKMGRPTESPRINQYRIRLTNEENEKLNYCSEETGKTKAEVLRMGLEKVYSEIKSKEK